MHPCQVDDGLALGVLLEAGQAEFALQQFAKVYDIEREAKEISADDLAPGAGALGAIIGALFNGMRIGQIAARDGVSPKTVRNQLSGVFAKLGVASQTELLDAYDAPPR